MQRRKPASAKQRKAQLQLKRAVKRGDVPPSDPKTSHHRKLKSVRRGPTGRPLSPGSSVLIASSRRLQSSFIKLPPRFLEESRHLASVLILPRPIASTVAIFDNLTLSHNGRFDDLDDVTAEKLICPRRPKWRYDMTKKEVEKNEEAMFNQWLSLTDNSVGHWLKNEQNKKDGDHADEETRSQKTSMPSSPTYFERNLEVWRQL
jgi:hypothetical protein